MLWRLKLNDTHKPTTVQIKKNPKSHDSLFKWLIAAFLEDFFNHYFPDVTIKIGKDPFLDKEFIQKYEALKESIKGDVQVFNS